MTYFSGRGLFPVSKILSIEKNVVCFDEGVKEQRSSERMRSCKMLAGCSTRC